MYLICLSIAPFNEMFNINVVIDLFQFKDYFSIHININNFDVIPIFYYHKKVVWVNLVAVTHSLHV